MKKQEKNHLNDNGGTWKRRSRSRRRQEWINGGINLSKMGGVGENFYPTNSRCFS